MKSDQSLTIQILQRSLVKRCCGSCRAGISCKHGGSPGNDILAFGLSKAMPKIFSCIPHLSSINMASFSFE
jgi:hypothetical protein